MRRAIPSILLILAALLACSAMASAIAPVWPGPDLPPEWLPLVAASWLLWVSLGWYLWRWWGGLVLSAVAATMLLWVAAATRDPLWLLDLACVGCVSTVCHRRQLRASHQEQAVRSEADDTEEARNALEASVQAAHADAEGLHSRLARYQTLQAIGEELAGLLQLEAVGELIVERCFTLVGASEACLLFLVDTDRQELALFCSKRAPGVPSVRTKHGDAFDQWVLRNRRPLLVDDVTKDYRFAPEASPDREVRSLIACPMQVSQRVTGILRLESRAVAAYRQDDLRFISVLLDLAAAAADNASLYAQMQRLALVDSLTGLRLKRVFMETFQQELIRASRRSGGVGLLMIDIDHFKAYNDRLGHVAGDAVLKGVASLLHRFVAGESLVARYGGEEFAVLLVDELSRDPDSIAEAIRNAIASEVFAIRQEPTHVTVSIGVAQFPADGTEPVDLLRAADARLYEAKRAGRNRVCSGSLSG